MSANFVSHSANLSSLSQLCQKFSKSVVHKQIISAIQQICLSLENSTKACMTTSSVSNSANQQISNFFADEANCNSPKQILSAIQQICFFVSKLCQQLYPVSRFFCRRQQHEYSTDVSSFMLARLKRK